MRHTTAAREHLYSEYSLTVINPMKSLPKVDGMGVKFVPTLYNYPFPLALRPNIEFPTIVNLTQLLQHTIRLSLVIEIHDTFDTILVAQTTKSNEHPKKHYGQKESRKERRFRTPATLFRDPTAIAVTIATIIVITNPGTIITVFATDFRASRDTGVRVAFRARTARVQIGAGSRTNNGAAFAPTGGRGRIVLTIQVFEATVAAVNGGGGLLAALFDTAEAFALVRLKAAVAECVARVWIVVKTLAVVAGNATVAFSGTVR